MPPTDAIVLRREPGHFVRSLTALTLRAGLGMIFLIAGFQKYQQMSASESAAPAAASDEPTDADAQETPPGIESVGAMTNGDDPSLSPEEGGEDPAVEESEPDPASEEEGNNAAENGAEGGPPPYPDSIRGMFEETWLYQEMPWAVDLFTEFLPYVEMGVGALLIAGLLTTLAAFVSGLLLLGLLFGQLVLGNPDMYPNMLIYLLTNAGILWLSPVTSNYLSLDGFLFGWFWRPKAEGELRAEGGTGA